MGFSLNIANGVRRDIISLKNLIINLKKNV